MIVVQLQVGFSLHFRTSRTFSTRQNHVETNLRQRQIVYVEKGCKGLLLYRHGDEGPYLPEELKGPYMGPLKKPMWMEGAFEKRG